MKINQNDINLMINLANAFTDKDEAAVVKYINEVRKLNSIVRYYIIKSIFDLKRKIVLSTIRNKQHSDEFVRYVRDFVNSVLIETYNFPTQGAEHWSAKEGLGCIDLYKNELIKSGI